MLLLLLAIAVARLEMIRRRCRKKKHDKTVRLLGLTTAAGERFFGAIHASQNRSLFRDHFRMDSAVFDSLFEACKGHIRSSLEYPREVLAVALNWIGTAATCRAQEVLFDLAYSTVHKYRLHGVYAIVRALHHLTALPASVPSDFKKRHPYFDQALCAIDGTHFSVVVPNEDIKRFRNYKGFISTNVLIACDWSMRLCSIYPGCEGSAHDSMVLQWSHFLDNIPDNFYVLADAGYALSPKVLTPYRGVRYHLKEWGNSAGWPSNGKELYNLRHAKARNVVERVIGLLKRRFRVLRTPMDFEMINIKVLIFASGIVHNFIRDFDQRDLGEDFDEEEEEEEAEDGNASYEDGGPIAFDFQSGTSWRKWMTTEMWREYDQCRRSGTDSNQASVHSEGSSDGELGTSSDEGFYSSEDDRMSSANESSDIDGDISE